MLADPIIAKFAFYFPGAAWPERTAATASDTLLRPAREGPASANGHVQLLGEIPLQICRRCTKPESPLQIAVAPCRKLDV
jgi:hypothetical protein